MNFTEHVKIREEKFGAVIFETLREKIFVTNETGKNILHLLTKGHASGEIAEILSKIYKADTDDVKEDVATFISQLKNNYIIQLG